MKKSKIFLLISFLFLAGNFIWLLFFDNYNPNPNFEYNKFYTFQAVIKNQDKKIEGWNILLEPLELNNFSGDMLVYSSLYPEYSVGDRLEISCKIYKPEPILSEDGKSFSYDKYLAKDKIFGTCFRPRVKVLGQQEDFNFYLNKIKKYLWTNLNNNLTEPSSALTKAITLGARREITDDFRESFSKVGLSHIIAISGLHMAIIIFLLQYLLIAIGLDRKQAIFILIAIVILYLNIINFPSSALRASAMVFLFLLGPLIARQTLSVYSLVLVADIFILYNKYLLLYDIGFQLSFLAVLGLLLYVDFFNRTLVFLPKIFKIREVFAVTLAAQIFTWPIIIYNFKIFSIVAPIANFLILPLLPLILVCGFLLAIFDFAFLSWPIIILFYLIGDIVIHLNKIPYSYLIIDNFSAQYLALSYFFIIIITFILKPQQYEKN